MEVAEMAARLLAYRSRNEWGDPVEHAICEQAADLLTRLSAERDEADRRAGAAERRLERLEDENIKRRHWMDERKEEVGVGRNQPFDKAWATILARAERAESERDSERERAASLGRLYEAECARAINAEAERDALKAEKAAEGREWLKSDDIDRLQQAEEDLRALKARMDRDREVMKCALTAFAQVENYNLHRNLSRDVKIAADGIRAALAAAEGGKMLEQLKALSDRLEGLSGADRATDALIACAFEDFSRYDLGDRKAIGRPSERDDWLEVHVGCVRYSHPLAAYTASLDAAVALVERLYPLHEIFLTRRAWIQGIAWEVELGEGRQVEAPTAPLALLRALLAAKIEEAGHE